MVWITRSLRNGLYLVFLELLEGYVSPWYMKLFFAFLVRNFYMKLESISEKASSHLYRLFVLTYGGPAIAIYSGLNNKYPVPSHFVMGPCVLGMHLAQGSIAIPQFYRDVFMGLASLGLTPARPALG